MPFPGIKDPNFVGPPAPPDYIPPTGSAGAAKLASAGGGILAGISGMLNPLSAGLGLAGGLGDMFGSSGSSDTSEAGGTLYGGNFNPVIMSGGGNSPLLIILVVVAAIYFLRKK